MIRPLTGFEKAFCLSDPAVPINFCMIAQFTTAPDENDIAAALHLLKKKYVMAAVRLVDTESDQPMLTDEAVPDFPLRIVDDAGRSWQMVAADELGTIFPLEVGPLIRVVLAIEADGSAEMILTFHHGIADGMSAVYFLQDLLLLLENPDYPLTPMIDGKSVMSSIPDHSRTSFAVRSQQLGMKMGLHLMNRLGRFGVGFPAADRMISGKPSWKHIRTSTRILESDTVQALLAVCRREHTSMQGAICAAWLLAKQEILDERKRSPWKISIPVDLRKLTGSGPSFGMVMSNALITIKRLPNAAYWDIARDVKAKITETIETGRVYQWICVMHGLMDLPTRVIRLAMPSFVTRPPGYDFSISNLGRLQFSRHVNLSAVYGPIVNTSEQEFTVGISTVNGGMTMTFAFREFSLPLEIGERIIDRALELLVKSANVDVIS